MGHVVGFDARLRFLIAHRILFSETLPHSEHAACEVATFGHFLYLGSWGKGGNYVITIIDLFPLTLNIHCIQTSSVRLVLTFHYR